MEEAPIDIKEFDRLPQFIAVEGPIGAGKTTLTRLLADSLNYETFLEQPSENPFLPDFYINPSQAALATQLFFLFQRVKQIQELKQGDIFLNKRVSDFLLDKDRLFAKATLSSEELKLYEQIYQYLAIDLPTPDLVIYLQADTKTLYERVMHRGIEMEKTISFDYLDLQTNKSDYNLLLKKLLDYFNKPEGSKMYFNPSPTLI